MSPSAQLISAHSCSTARGPGSRAGKKRRLRDQSGGRACSPLAHKARLPRLPLRGGVTTTTPAEEQPDFHPANFSPSSRSISSPRAHTPRDWRSGAEENTRARAGRGTAEKPDGARRRRLLSRCGRRRRRPSVRACAPPRRSFCAPVPRVCVSATDGWDCWESGSRRRERE